MSGGNFDYTYSKINDFIAQLENEIIVNDSFAIDQYGNSEGKNYSYETIERLKKSLSVIKLASKLSREIGWLYSGDSGEESFCKSINEILGCDERY